MYCRLCSSSKSSHHLLGTVIMKLRKVPGYLRDCTTLPKRIAYSHLATAGMGGAAAEARIALGGGRCSRVSKGLSLPKPSPSLVGEEGHPGLGVKRRTGEPGKQQEENSRSYAPTSRIGVESKISWSILKNSTHLKYLGDS